MKKTGSKKIAVVYHASCPDGFGAAWAAWKKFGDRAEYHAVAHTDKPLALDGKEVYFLDIVYGPAAMRAAVKAASKVTVVDHHVTAKESVRLADESLYEMGHSGAFLAWKHFHPGKPTPKILLHIEDEDLWRFKLSGTAAVTARLELLEFDFKTFDKVVTDFEKPAFRKKFIQEGELLRAYRARLVRRIIQENATPVRFLGHRAFAVNATKPFASEIGNLLCRARPPIGIVWQERNGVLTVSLRSNGSVDVAKIAQRFGGGGHKAAAGFSLPVGAKRPWTLEKSGKKK